MFAPAVILLAKGWLKATRCPTPTTRPAPGFMPNLCESTLMSDAMGNVLQPCRISAIALKSVEAISAVSNALLLQGPKREPFGQGPSS